MNVATPTVSPLRQRMIDDMTLRRFSPKTQAAYIRAVLNFTRFLGRAPDRADVEDLRRYQLHMAEHGVSSTTLNATLSGLRFFFETTVDRPRCLSTYMSHILMQRCVMEHPFGRAPWRGLTRPRRWVASCGWRRSSVRDAVPERPGRPDGVGPGGSGRGRHGVPPG